MSNENNKMRVFPAQSYNLWYGLATRQVKTTDLDVTYVTEVTTLDGRMWSLARPVLKKDIETVLDDADLVASSQSAATAEEYFRSVRNPWAANKCQMDTWVHAAALRAERS